MIDVSRRRFFGFMAAPAVIGVDKRMSFWMPKRELIVPVAAIERPDAATMFARDAIDSSYERFRQLVEPQLRECFDKVYADTEPLFGGAITRRRENLAIRAAARKAGRQDEPEWADDTWWRDPVASNRKMRASADWREAEKRREIEKKKWTS